jgi:hypothetical protein
MPKKTTESPWVTALQDSVLSASTRGWSVTKSGTKVRLRVRSGAGGANGCWSRTLPFTWEICCIGLVTTLIGGLHRLVADGNSLDAAWEQLQGDAISAEPSATTTTAIGPNWKVLSQDFLRDRQQNGTRIGEKTLAAEQRYLGEALALLAGRRPPTTAYDLISQVVRRWEDKPRARKQAVETVMRFLDFGVSHAGLPECWVLPAAQKSKLVGPTGKKSTKATLSDTAILELIDACPSSEWQHVLNILATYGLRPEELFHLQVRTNPATGKKQFWCGYEKRSGVHKTKQRWLYPVPLTGADGQQVLWDLPGLFEKGLLTLPPMAERGEALSQYLRRLPLWRRWRAEAAERGEVLRPYTFRDSYSLRGHLLGIPASQMAAAMGHSLQVHSASYVWSDAGSTAATFERLMGVS